jgi:hypothetical protein
MGRKIIWEGRRTACPKYLTGISNDVCTTEQHIGKTFTKPGRQVSVPVAPIWNSEVAPRLITNL